MQNGSFNTPAWTLILWDIDTASVPDQLRDPAGLKKLKELLRNNFARSRRLQLHCIKLACCWPDHKSPYASLLGGLITSGDVEALAYHWQGQADKAQTANKLLKQAADRFMQMLEAHGGPEHLVVFISSDPSLDEKVQELQRRNFRVVVIYHATQANRNPASIINVADEAYDWLTFLKQELQLPHLSISPYLSSSTQTGHPSAAPSVVTYTTPRAPAPVHVVRSTAPKTLPLPTPFHSGNQYPQSGASARPQMYRPVPSGSGLQPGTSYSSFTNGNPRQPNPAGGPGVIGMHAHRSAADSALSKILPDLLPESSASALPGTLPGQPKLPPKPQPGGKPALANGDGRLASQGSKVLIVPRQDAPMVVPKHDAPPGFAGRAVSSGISLGNDKASDRPHSVKQDGVPAAKQDHPLRKVQVFANMEALLTAVSLNHPSPSEQLLRVVVTACLMHGFHGTSQGYQLRPVSCCQIGVAVKSQLPDMQGKLLVNLEMPPCKPCLRLIAGPLGGQPAVLPDLEMLIGSNQPPMVSGILSEVETCIEHPNDAQARSRGSTPDSASGREGSDAARDHVKGFSVPEARCILGLCIDSGHASDRDGFIRAVADACLQRKFESAAPQPGYKLSPVLLCQVGTVVRQRCPHMPGKLLDYLKDPALKSFFHLIPGPTESALLVDLAALIAQPHPPEVVTILSKTRVIDLHPHFLPGGPNYQPGQ